MADTDSQPGGAPPAGFVEFNGNYYRYVKGLFTFYEAQAAAEAAGGHLATIGSAAENAFLASLIAGQDLGAWLGGSDAGSEGVWKWTEGPEDGEVFWTGLSDGSATPGAYTNWSIGEPNGVWNGIEEDHFHMMANSDKWNDASGQWVTMGYFIEIEGTGNPPPPAVNGPPVISSNGGGATASLLLAENGFTVTTVTATDPEGDTPSFAIAGGADAFLFTIDAATGALSFKAAPDFEAPGDAGGNNVYDVTVRASANGGEDTQALAITLTDLSEPPAGNGPPAGFVELNGHYYRYVKGLYTFYEAQAAAEAAGGHLATIGSAAENAFLASLIAGQDLGAWLGGSDAASEGVWQWTEGPEDGQVFWTGLSGGSATPGAYTNWSIGEPNGIWNGIEEDHFHMMANSDKWNDTSGQWVTMGYFIEIEGTGNPPPPPVNGPPVITSNGGGATASILLAENGFTVTTVTATDPEGDTPSFAIAGGADAFLFAIDSATGSLAFKAAPDFEAPGDAGGNNVYDVIVRASANGGEDTQALAITVTDVNETPSGQPPAGFTAFNGHFYRYVKGDFTHSQASALAQAEGGHLATITSAAENAFLADLMAQANPWGYGGWLGGSDAASEGVWRWTEGPESGEVFWNGLSGGSAPAGQFTRWLPGEPSQYQGTEEDHLHMLTGTDQWNDIPNQFWFTMGYFVEISA